MKPERSILDRSFVYTPSHRTDVRETFERARKRLEQEKTKRAPCVQLPKRNPHV